MNGFESPQPIDCAVYFHPGYALAAVVIMGLGCIIVCAIGAWRDKRTEKNAGTQVSARSDDNLE